jgi:hypothetical protein
MAQALESRDAQRIRLERVNTAALPHQSRELERVDAKARADVENGVSLPDESPQDTERQVTSTVELQALEARAQPGIHLARDADRCANRIYEAH